MKNNVEAGSCLSDGWKEDVKRNHSVISRLVSLKSKIKVTGSDGR